MTVTETIKSALAKVEAQQDNFGRMDRFNVVEHWEVRKALEKQIPKKPIIKTNAYNKKFYECTNCGIDIEDVIFGPYMYCHKCGQKIDKSEVEE